MEDTSNKELSWDVMVALAENEPRPAMSSLPIMDTTPDQLNVVEHEHAQNQNQCDRMMLLNSQLNGVFNHDWMPAIPQFGWLVPYPYRNSWRNGSVPPRFNRLYYVPCDAPFDNQNSIPQFNLSYPVFNNHQYYTIDEAQQYNFPGYNGTVQENKYPVHAPTESENTEYRMPITTSWNHLQQYPGQYEDQFYLSQPNHLFTGQYHEDHCMPISYSGQQGITHYFTSAYYPGVNYADQYHQFSEGYPYWAPSTWHSVGHHHDVVGAHFPVNEPSERQLQPNAEQQHNPQQPVLPHNTGQYYTQNQYNFNYFTGQNSNYPFSGFSYASQYYANTPYYSDYQYAGQCDVGQHYQEFSLSQQHPHPLYAPQQNAGLQYTSYTGTLNTTEQAGTTQSELPTISQPLTTLQPPFNYEYAPYQQPIFSYEYVPYPEGSGNQPLQDSRNELSDNASIQHHHVHASKPSTRKIAQSSSDVQLQQTQDPRHNLLEENIHTVESSCLKETPSAGETTLMSKHLGQSQYMKDCDSQQNEESETLQRPLMEHHTKPSSYVSESKSLYPIPQCDDINNNFTHPNSEHLEHEGTQPYYYLHHKKPEATEKGYSLNQTNSGSERTYISDPLYQQSFCFDQDHQYNFEVTENNFSSTASELAGNDYYYGQNNAFVDQISQLETNEEESEQLYEITGEANLSESRYYNSNQDRQQFSDQTPHRLYPMMTPSSRFRYAPIYQLNDYLGSYHEYYDFVNSQRLAEQEDHFRLRERHRRRSKRRVRGYDRVENIGHNENTAYINDEDQDKSHQESKKGLNVNAVPFVPSSISYTNILPVDSYDLRVTQHFSGGKPNVRVQNRRIGRRRTTSNSGRQRQSSESEDDVNRERGRRRTKNLFLRALKQTKSRSLCTSPIAIVKPHDAEYGSGDASSSSPISPHSPPSIEGAEREGTLSPHVRYYRQHFELPDYPPEPLRTVLSGEKFMDTGDTTTCLGYNRMYPPPPRETLQLIYQLGLGRNQRSSRRESRTGAIPRPRILRPILGVGGFPNIVHPRPPAYYRYPYTQVVALPWLNRAMPPCVRPDMVYNFTTRYGFTDRELELMQAQGVNPRLYQYRGRNTSTRFPKH